ncbi:MAG: hypothetical protein IKS49_01080 [Actinomycetaceae bacterium]|nr:hypothetical protein [Actinomycetaceae bacterium]
MQKLEEWLLATAMIVHCLVGLVEIPLMRAGGVLHCTDGVFACIAWLPLFYCVKYISTMFGEPLQDCKETRGWWCHITELLAIFLDIGYLVFQYAVAWIFMKWLLGGTIDSIEGWGKVAMACVVAACLAFGTYMAYCSVKYDIKYRVFIANKSRLKDWL